jgi:hypothetical protein
LPTGDFFPATDFAEAETVCFETDFFPSAAFRTGFWDLADGFVSVFLLETLFTVDAFLFEEFVFLLLTAMFFLTVLDLSAGLEAATFPFLAEGFESVFPFTAVAFGLAVDFFADVFPLSLALPFDLLFAFMESNLVKFVHFWGQYS